MMELSGPPESNGSPSYGPSPLLGAWTAWRIGQAILNSLSAPMTPEEAENERKRRECETWN